MHVTHDWPVLRKTGSSERYVFIPRWARPKAPCYIELSFVPPEKDRLITPLEVIPRRVGSKSYFEEVSSKDLFKTPFKPPYRIKPWVDHLVEDLLIALTPRSVKAGYIELTADLFYLDREKALKLTKHYSLPEDDT